MTIGITEEAVATAAGTLADAAGDLALDLRWWAPDCGDAAAGAALEEWLGCVALVTATSATAVRSLGEDAEVAAGTLAEADAGLARSTPAAGTGRARAV